MIKKIYSSIISLFRSNQKEELKNVIVDLIDENKSSTEKIDDGTKNIFKNVINLSDKCIEDVMIPRASIIAVQQNYSFKQINDIINKESHSRMPVYRKDLDDILGMVHIKDIIKFYQFNKKSKGWGFL